MIYYLCVYMQHLKIMESTVYISTIFKMLGASQKKCTDLCNVACTKTQQYSTSIISYFYTACTCYSTKEIL